MSPAAPASSWAFLCTLRKTHQRGAAGYSAPAADLGLPTEAWPATLLATLPDHRLLVLIHAYTARAGRLHLYHSVKPHQGVTLVVWND